MRDEKIPFTLFRFHPSSFMFHPLSAPRPVNWDVGPKFPQEWKGGMPRLK